MGSSGRGWVNPELIRELAEQTTSTVCIRSGLLDSRPVSVVAAVNQNDLATRVWIAYRRTHLNNGNGRTASARPSLGSDGSS